MMEGEGKGKGSKFGGEGKEGGRKIVLRSNAPVWSGPVWSVCHSVVWSGVCGQPATDIDHLSRQLTSGLVGSETSRCKAKLVKSGGFNAAGCWLMVAAIIDPCATSWNMSGVVWFTSSDNCHAFAANISAAMINTTKVNMFRSHHYRPLR